jgi:hypothetical protein
VEIASGAAHDGQFVVGPGRYGQFEFGSTSSWTVSTDSDCTVH